MTEHNEWVSLGEAASMLGVHPSTVRHWADSGDLPFQRTPGGHRRFRRQDLKRWLTLHSEPTETAAAEAQLVLQNALGRARLEVVSGRLQQQDWYSDLNDDARRTHGQMGRQLLELLAEFLTTPGESDDILKDVHQLGAEYAALSIKNELTLSQTVRTFIFFRDVMTESVIQMAEMLRLHTPSDWGHRLQQVNHITDEMLLTLIATYETKLRN